MQLSINVCVYVCVYDSHFVAQHESEADRAAVHAETVVEAGTRTNAVAVAEAVAEPEAESAGNTAYALFVFANKFNNENNATKNSLYANKGLGRSWPDSTEENHRSNNSDSCKMQRNLIIKHVCCTSRPNHTTHS